MADRILITGGAGRLATELAKSLPSSTLLPGRRDLNVARADDCDRAMHGIGLVIHCAAVLSLESERDHLRAWAVNVEGTRNVMRSAARAACRMVYISTDYVFSGESGPYEEDDFTCPVNFYGLTKLRGEEITTDSPNNLVVRAPFRYRPWPYDNAFTDQWTSARWLSEVAPDIAEAAQSDLTGILHIGGPRRSLYEMAAAAGEPVRESKREDWAGLRIPRDVSLDSSRWQQWKTERPAVARWRCSPVQ